MTSSPVPKNKLKILNKCIDSFKRANCVIGFRITEECPQHLVVLTRDLYEYVLGSILANHTDPDWSPSKIHSILAEFNIALDSRTFLFVAYDWSFESHTTFNQHLDNFTANLTQVWEQS